MEGLKHYRKRLRALIPQRLLFCYLCGELIMSQREFSLDHVVPKSRGGATLPDNLLPAHKRCNELKGNMYLAEYLEKQR